MIEGNFFTSLNGFINGFMQIPKIIPLREPLKNEIQKFYNYGNYMGRFVKEKRYYFYSTDHLLIIKQAMIKDKILSIQL